MSWKNEIIETIVNNEPVVISSIVFRQFIFSEGFTVSRDTIIQISIATIVIIIKDIFATPFILYFYLYHNFIRFLKTLFKFYFSLTKGASARSATYKLESF